MKISGERYRGIPYNKNECFQTMRKNIGFGNQRLKITTAILLLLLLFSQQDIHIETSETVKHSMIENNVDCHIRNPKASEIDHLPSASINMLLVGGPLGNNINATITVGFSLSDNYSLGFQQEFLGINTGPATVKVVGLGYDEMREYPFFYTSSGELFDYTLTPYPSWTSRRHYAAWTALNTIELYLGPISEDNITDALYCGDIIEFENLTIYFEDGSSFVCGPRLVTLKANFSKSAENWDTQVTIQTSDNQGVTIKENLVEIALRYSEPLSPLLPVTGIAVGVITLIGLLLYRKRSQHH